MCGCAVSQFAGHIACSATTRSEIVVPILARSGRLMGVLDIDLDIPDAFGETDVRGLEKLCAKLGSKYGTSQALPLAAMANPAAS